MVRSFPVALALVSALFVTQAQASLVDTVLAKISDTASPAMRNAAAGTTCVSAVGFSPEGTAARLVNDTIDGAHHSIHVAAYSFTSIDIARHLIDARRRGVEVAVLADERENLDASNSKASRAALKLLSDGGIAVRMISAYPIFHEKSMIVDNSTVETGSFNFSFSGARRNSENALVVTQCPELAGRYESHWQARWSQGVPYRTPY